MQVKLIFMRAFPCLSTRPRFAGFRALRAAFSVAAAAATLNGFAALPIANAKR